MAFLSTNANDTDHQSYGMGDLLAVRGGADKHFSGQSYPSTRSVEPSPALFTSRMAMEGILETGRRGYLNEGGKEDSRREVGGDGVGNGSGLWACGIFLLFYPYRPRPPAGMTISTYSCLLLETFNTHATSPIPLIDK